MGDPRVVAGEMYDWSERTPAGGPLFVKMVRTLVPEGVEALVIGPHADEVLTAVTERAAKTTVVLRSVQDSLALAERFGDALEIVVGGLKGWAESRADKTFGALIALDGFDRLHSNDDPAMPWVERAALVTSALAPGGTMLLAHQGPIRVSDVLDTRPAHRRHGDDEFVPVFTDATRPGTPAALAESLGDVRSVMWAGFGLPAEPGVLLKNGVDADPALIDRVVVASLSAHQQWLADPRELLTSAMRGGILPQLADVWVCAVRPSAAAADVWLARGGTGVITANRGDDDWTINDGQAERTFPRAETVGERILGLAESEDTPAIRELAHELAEAVRAGNRLAAVDPAQAVLQEGVLVDAWAPPAVALTSPAEAFGAAWFVVLDRIEREHRRHPWQPWVLGAPLVKATLSECGFEADDQLVERCRAAASKIEAEQNPAAELAVLRDQLANYEDMVLAVHELRGHISGLERTLRLRDGQLRALQDPSYNPEAPGTEGGVKGAMKAARRVLHPESVAKLAMKASQVNSLGELRAGVRRVVRRARRG